MNREKVCIVGSGNWGSTISKVIGFNVQKMEDWVDPEVNLWVFEELVDGRKLTEIINEDHENIKYLPGVKLPENVRAVTDLAEACSDASILVFVLPHQFLGKALDTIKRKGNIRQGARAISLIKGLDASSSAAGIDLASRQIERALSIRCSVMMGANLANEVAMEQFCESTIGSVQDGEVFKKLIQTDYFRLAVVKQVEAVELCGALKNIIAVGAGFVDGLLLGDNTKAAIIRIGLDEMRRFSRLFTDDSVSNGSMDDSVSKNDSVFFESCGVADLITSCFGGRNRRIGEAHVTTGKSIEQLEAELLGGQKLQGPPAAKEVYKFLSERGLTAEFPLMTAVYQICYEAYPPDHIIKNLSKSS